MGSRRILKRLPCLISGAGARNAGGCAILLGRPPISFAGGRAGNERRDSSHGDGMALDENVLEIALDNELQEIAGVAAQVDAFCEARGLSPDVAYAVNLSVDEILTNSISYGYDDDETHRIEVVVRMEADSLVVVITDDSAPFDVSAGSQADVESGLEDRDIGGLGIFLVHQMMDKVEYERVDGRNVVTLTKHTAGAG